MKRYRDKKVVGVLIAVLCANWAVAAAKLLVGAIVGSLALFADGVHSLLDGASNLVGLVGVLAASRPPDDGHPYGHRRFETLAALVIALFVVGGLAGIVRAVVQAAFEQRPPPAPTMLSAIIVAATVIAGVWVSRYELSWARRIGSSVLEADSAHSMTDALGSLAVLASFLGTWLGVRYADLIAAAIVCVLIARTAWSLVRRNVHALADGVQIDPTAVLEVAKSVRGVRSADRIRSRGCPDYIHVDLQIQLDPWLSLVDAHGKSHEVASAIKRAFPRVRDVVIHTAPSKPEAAVMHKARPSAAR